MKAYVEMTYRCECGHILFQSESGPDALLHCSNKKCKHHNRKYHLPKFELQSYVYPWCEIRQELLKFENKMVSFSAPPHLDVVFVNGVKISHFEACEADLRTPRDFIDYSLMVKKMI
jgi:hypothetical protein